ncbi:hypothetical protein [Collimonas arenae]|uniref:hypothetical protein n=1 Tax=Collimonas arenae TaxID=279058 RepID=UPI00077830BD|nr:hypothetical protein [Collimonas arenae]
MSTQVALVLDEKNSEAVKSLVNKMPVWIIKTKDNDALTKELRDDFGLGVSITTFPAEENESKTQAAERIIYSLNDHHDEHACDDPYDTLLVSGIALQDSNLDAYRDLGFSQFEETDFGFIARKA